ncbi:hypothetical protein HPB47_019034 [Ixodes persulcatus]|uniref:Uncharacterized protein n=1 Tax=Ixodes persulcatus TaxID=34615 RepID=A0AC60QJG0_IXOPE|nr:hypothetical protein HPB47_019034 [Ixodes persulcatus]
MIKCFSRWLKIWQQQQDELFGELVGTEVDLAGDGRYDSPGFCAKYMTHSLHATQVNKILHFEQVQVEEHCHELSKCLEKVKGQGHKVASVTTDRHVQVTKYMRTEEPTIQHYFDRWHISKGRWLSMCNYMLGFKANFGDAQLGLPIYNLVGPTSAPQGLKAMMWAPGRLSIILIILI